MTKIVSKGKNFDCWIYFNRTHNSLGEVFHSTYTQEPLRSWVHEEENIIKTSCNQFIFDEVATEDESPMCIGCYTDLEYDGFNNYHCNQCDEWYAESEVTQFNTF
jgi:hypothetical protein